MFKASLNRMEGRIKVFPVAAVASRMQYTPQGRR